MRVSIIDETLKIYRENRVIIFGASASGKGVYSIFESFQIKTAFFVDNDREKWGSQCCGLPVCAPDDLSKQKDSFVVQIASTAEDEIAAQLREMGIDCYIMYSEAIHRLINLNRYQYFKQDGSNYAYYMQHVYESLAVPKIQYLWGDVITNNMYSPEESIWLCMPPKTGDYTVMNSLTRAGKRYVNFIHSEYAMTKQLQKAVGGRKIKVICGVREPIAQNLSLIYQLEQDGLLWNMKEDWQDGGDVAAILRRLLENEIHYIKKEHYDSDLLEMKDMQYYPHTYFIQNFFQQEFKRNLGIDILAHPFDVEEGYGIVKEGNIEIFLYQLERLNVVYEKLFEFLGIAGSRLVTGNSAEDKWYNRYYREAKKNISLPADYIDWSYECEFTKHFYSGRQIEEYMAAWKK